MSPTAQASANQACAAALVASLTASLAPGQQRHVVVSPGSRSTPLALAFATAKGVALHVVLDERAAAFCALGLGQATGLAAAVVTTSGSAAAHALPAAMEAHHAGIPLLLLTADRPAEAHDVGAAQTTSQVSLYANHTRGHFALPAPVDGPCGPKVVACWEKAAAHARQLAEGQWPGPVHLNCPFREPLGTHALPSAPSARGGERVHVAAPTNAPAAALPGAVERLLARAERGLIVCGPQLPATRPAADYAAALWAFAGHSGWSVMAEATANLGQAPAAVSARAGPIQLSAAEALLGHPAVDDLPAPDVVLVLGQAPAGRNLGRLLARKRGAAVLRLQPPSVRIDPYLNADYLLHSAATPALAAMRQALPGAPKPSQRAFAAAWQRAERVVEEAVAASMQPERPFFEGTAVRLVGRSLPPEATLVVGNSLAVRDLDTFGGGTEGRLFFAARRGVSGIDGALAHALGIALATAAGQVWALLGDLTFLHDVQSLRLLAQAGRAMTIIVLDNAGGQIFSQLPIAENQEVFAKLFATPQEANVGAIVAAFGGDFVPVNDALPLASALAASRERPQAGVRVIWVDVGADAARARSEAQASFARVALPGGTPR